MSLVKSAGNWVRQSFSWSNSLTSWQERGALALFLLTAVGLGILSAWLPFTVAVVCWVFYVGALTLGHRQGWVQLFGPVLFYDMVRTARQSRYVILRLLYAGLLLFVLCFLYLSIASNRRLEIGPFFYHMAAFIAFLLVQVVLMAWLRFVSGRRGRFALMSVIAGFSFWLLVYVVYLAIGDEVFGIGDERRLTAREAATLAETFFLAFMFVQLFMVLLMTPAYVAGAIAEEKERKTLEFMLATDLSNHEIVLSKLLSRLVNIALLLMTALPMLSILQFLGGVDAELMLAGFAGTGLTMLGVGSLSILFSTLLKRPRDAIGITYLAMIAYGALGTLGKGLVMSGQLFMSESIWPTANGPTYAEVSAWINIGNPIAAMIDVARAINTASLAADLPGILTNYAWFHLSVALVCILWSIVRLRAIALKQTVAGTTKKLGWGERHRPAIGDLPMLWKELHIEGRNKLNWVAWIVVILLVVLTVGSGLSVLVAYAWDKLFKGGGGMWHLTEDMNAWFRTAGTGVAGLMVLMVGVRASTCITGERERDTFDALLTTPMSAEAMLGAKLLGCLMSVRLGWLWFGAMLAVGLFSGGIHLFAVPILIVSWFIYAVFFAMIGMWFSMVCQSSMRATALTVLTTLFLGGGHWLLMGLCLYFPAALLMDGGQGNFLEYVAKFELGMTPPFVIGFCSYSWENLARDFHRQREFGADMFVFCLIGLFLWALGCVILWYGLLLPKFRDLARREELIYQ